MDKVNSQLESIVKKNGGTSKDWKDLIKSINSKPEEAKLFCTNFKQIIKESSPSQKIIALDLLDFLMTEGNLPLHNQVNSKDFITHLLSMLKNKDSPEVQFKILSLLKKWGVRFENKRDVLPNFYETYNTLKNSKVVFPEKVESTYFKYLAEPSSEFDVDRMYPNFSNLNVNDNDPFSKSPVNNLSKNSPNTQNINQNVIKSDSSAFGFGSGYGIDDNPQNNYGDICLDLEPGNYPKKYKKFVNELNTLLNCIIISNEMIDNVDPKSSLDEGVREVVSQLRDLDQNLQMAISNQIDDEKLMAICLGINEDIIKLFKRYDDLKAHKKPETFISNFHTDYAEFNLNNRKDNKKNVNSTSDVKNENPFGFPSNYAYDSNSSSGVGNPGNNANLIDFGFGGEGTFNNSNKVSNSNVNNSANKNDVKDIFDILNQFNK